MNNPLKQHPNAIVGGVLGGGALGQSILALLAQYGVHLSSRQSGLVTVGAATAVLLFGGPIKYIWQNGTDAVWQRIRHGAGGKAGAETAALEPSASAPVHLTVHLTGDASQMVAALDDAKVRLLAAAHQPEPPA